MAPEAAYDAFISYSHVDGDWVRTWLVPRLKQAGLRIHIDTEDFRVGDTVIEAMTAAITASRFTILVFTRSFVESEWGRFERVFSLHLSMSAGRQTIPLMFERCDIPNPFNMLVYADFTREHDREYRLKQLVAQLKGRAAVDTQSEPTSVVVRSHYRNFNVEFSPSGRSLYVVRASCPSIGRAATEVVTIDVDELRARAVKVKSGRADRDASQQMGRALYRTIFTPDVVRLWNAAQETVSSDDGKGVLRLRLRFSDHDQLSALPWELLHDQHSFVAMALQRPVVRYSADVQATMARRSSVLVADTLSAPSAHAEEAIQVVTRYMGGRRSELQVVRNAALPDLQEKLRVGNYDVVHLIGRGDGAGRLLLRTGGSGVLPVDGEMFGILLRDSPVRLVVLAAVDEGAGGPTALLGVAEGISRAGIPAVVAMQGDMPAEAVHAFARAFYRYLADGCPVEACLAEGRKAIMNLAGLDKPLWAFPVLFNNADDVMLFRSEPADYCFGVELAPSVVAGAPAASPRASLRREATTPLHNLGDGAERGVIGRDPELAAVRAALVPEALNRVLLLSGDAGMGKTSIAAVIAREALTNATFDTIIWMSPQDPDLARLDDPQHCQFGRISLKGLTTVVLRTLEQRRLLTLDVSSRLREIAAVLAYGRHLIVVDDLPPASHAAVRTFIEAMPSTVHFIVTASQRLGIGEQEIAVGPTGATIPFIHNAEEQRSKRLRSRMRSRPATPADYLRAILPGLPDAWKSILAVCATLPFRAGETIVHTASGLDRRKFDDALGALLDMRLVHREQKTFLVLSGALRSLFREGNEELRAELPPVERQCVAAYLAFVRRKRSGPADADLHPELGNLVWAVQRSYASGAFRNLKTFREKLDATLFHRALYPLAIGIGELAYLAASRVSDFEEMGWAALYPLARVNYHRRNLALAERWCATALAIFEQQHHDGGIIAAKRYLGRIKQSEGDMARARQLFQEMLQRTSRLKKPKPLQLGLAQATLAGLAEAEKKHAEAEKLYRRALALYEKDAHNESIGTTLEDIGRLYLERDPVKALDHFERAKKTLAGTAARTTRTASLAFVTGQAFEQQGRFKEAEQQFRTAREIFAEAEAPAEELAKVDAALVRVTARLEHEECSPR